MPTPPTSTARPSPLRVTPPRRATADALGGIRSLLTAAAIICALYFGREVLIPLSLALLITFLLAPVVQKMERRIRHIPAVLVALMVILVTTFSFGWILTHQVVDLAGQVPGYKENIRAKLQSIKIPEGGAFTKLTEAFNDLKKDVPKVIQQGADNNANQAAGDSGEKAPMPVKIVEGPSANPFELARTWATPILGPLGTAALVFLLVAFMLLKWDDLRGRVLRLAGQGRISMTTRAMDDAGKRIRRYLLMQVVVNVTYGIPLAIGLSLIGVPNAILWGALAAVLRFIPYIGPWIAATFPILLSLAVAPSWWAPALTIGLFVVLELISNNLLEPWLYGSSTGVSSIALIIAAVFWTWMWGPVGLVLATPITVWLVVMGQHIPQLAFLNVVMGEEEALTPAEDCYHRLLRTGDHLETDFTDGFLKNHSLNELYDTVLIPVIIATETDFRRGLLDTDQYQNVSTSLADLTEELSEKFRPEVTLAEDEVSAPAGRIRCIPARAEREDLASTMVAHTLAQKGFDSAALTGRRDIDDLAKQFEHQLVDLIIISVISPSKAIHARNLIEKLRVRVPDQKIAVGLWGITEDTANEGKMLREAGAEIVFVRITDAVAYCEQFLRELSETPEPAPPPEDEEQRLASLDRLAILDSPPIPSLNRMTAKCARIFEVPTVSITLVDQERQIFKAHTGLPPHLAEAGSTPRCLSVCTYVVSAGGTVVIEDLARDRRFANNPLLQDNGTRFYAGSPIKTKDGHTIGSLCLMDVAPRRFSQSERRMLEENAAEVAEIIERVSKERGLSLSSINAVSKAGLG